MQVHHLQHTLSRKITLLGPVSGFGLSVGLALFLIVSQAYPSFVSLSPPIRNENKAGT